MISGNASSRSTGFPRKCRWAKIAGTGPRKSRITRSEEHTSELQSLMRISYAVFCLKKKKKRKLKHNYTMRQKHTTHNKKLTNYELITEHIKRQRHNRVN